MVKQRRMFIDIETSPCFGWFWWTGKTYNTIDQILEEPKIICICYAWEDDDQVYYLSWDMKTKDDKQMLKEFCKIAQDATELIGHNSDNFDIRFINSRVAYHGLTPLPPLRTEDTIKQCKRKFRLPSYKLDYICKFLGIPQKKSTGGISLWLKICLDKDEKALNYMVEYCANDVVILKALDQRLRGYVPLARYPVRKKGEVPSFCGLCNSKVILKGYYETRDGIKHPRGVCSNKECRQWHYGSKQIYQPKEEE